MVYCYGSTVGQSDSKNVDCGSNLQLDDHCGAGAQAFDCKRYGCWFKSQSDDLNVNFFCLLALVMRQNGIAFHHLTLNVSRI